MKLYWKIYLLSISLVVISVGLLATIVSIDDATRLLDGLRDDQRIHAGMAASQVEAGYHEKIWPFEMLQTLSQEKNIAFWAVVDGDGHVVLSSQPGENSDLPDVSVQKGITDASRFEIGSDTEAWVVPMRMRTGTKPWTFQLGYHTRSIDQQIHKQAAINIALAVGISIVLLPILLVVMRRTMRPLAALTEAAHQMKQGNLDISLPTETSGETRELISAFDAMAASIKTRDAELRAARDELERRVEDRTAELVKSNESLKFSQFIIEHIKDGMWVVNADGSIGNVNDAVCKAIGYSREELTGKPIWEIDPNFTEEKWPGAWEMFRSQGYCTIETLHRRKDGEDIPVEIAVSNYAAYGKDFNVCFVRDITERKRAEADLINAKESAEKANAAKSEFLAKMSHEIRTPMNGIIGMTGLALDTELTGEQHEYMTMVRDSADSLLGIINDILDFSKIEAGKMELDSTEFSLRGCLGDPLAGLGIRADEKGLELMCDISTDVPDTIVGDPTRLRQIIFNLVGNALKFTHEGEIVIAVEQECRDEANTHLHFSVRDTGPGIPLDKQQRIFEAFEQVDSSTTRKFGGTGLGLSITRQLVEIMGGRMWLDSEPGRGSTFHFTLSFPVAEQQDCRESLPLDLTDMPVLVVDDNATNRTILEKVLTSWHMEPHCVQSGPDAICQMRRAKQEGKAFPLVLLDVNMPEMDGFEVAERIKSDPDMAGATVMMLSSAGRRGDAVRCREIGVAVYLTKPVKQSDLLDAIMVALGAPTTRELPLVTRHSLRESRQKLRILLAEDNIVNQKLAVRMLEKRGHSVSVAETGTEVLDLLSGEVFDIVLMDVQMPEMDGLEATRQIRCREQETGGRHTPIIAMTAHAMKGDSEMCTQAGMDGYVAKPIRPDAVFAEIQRVVQAYHMQYGESAIRSDPVDDDEEVVFDRS